MMTFVSLFSVYGVEGLQECKKKKNVAGLDIAHLEVLLT